MLGVRGESAKYMKTASWHLTAGLPHTQCSTGLPDMQVRWGGCEVSCDLEKRSRLRERVWIVSCYWMSYGARGRGREGQWMVSIHCYVCVCAYCVLCVCIFP